MNHFRDKPFWTQILHKRGIVLLITALSRPKSDEALVQQYLEQQLPLVKLIASAWVIGEIERLTEKKLKARFKLGRMRYGGKFDLEAIPCSEELHQEAMDVLLYTAIRLLQKDG